MSVAYGVIVFRLGGVPLAVFELFLLRLQFLRIPADAESVAEIVVLHIADKAVFGMDAVYGDLLARPIFIFDIRNGDGNLDKFFLPNGQVGIVPHVVRLPRLDLQIAFVDSVHDVFGNRLDVFYVHVFHLNSISSPNSSLKTATASASKAEMSKSSSSSGMGAPFCVCASSIRAAISFSRAGSDLHVGG